MESIKDYNHRIVSIEEGQPYECLVHKEDKRWNGWVCPLFTMKTFNKFYQDQLELITDFKEVRKQEKEFLEDLNYMKTDITTIDNVDYINVVGMIWSYHATDKMQLEEDLEDILGQLQMDKIDTKQALETLKNIVNYNKGENYIVRGHIVNYNKGEN